MKNAMLISGLLIITIAVISCRKNSVQVKAPIITGFSPDNTVIGDTIGEKITITGTGFIGTSSVSFGGTAAASFTVESADTIFATVGYGSTGKISVTAPGGIATYSGFLFPTIYCNCTSSNDIDSVNLIAHWSFDGNAEESISKLGPMATGGTITYVTGRIGQAISLNNGWLTYPAGATFAGDSNSFLSTNDTLQNGFTITLWAKLTPNVLGDSAITNLFQLSSYPGAPNWPLAGIGASKFADSTMVLFGGLTNEDSMGVHQSADSAYLGTLLDDTLSWAFIALIYDTPGQRLLYYFNGNYVGQSTLLTGNVSGSVFPISQVLHLPTPNYATIGAFESYSIFPFSPDAPFPNSFMNTGLTGELDDIRLYNIPLSGYNISDLYILGNEGR